MITPEELFDGLIVPDNVVIIAAGGYDHAMKTHQKLDAEFSRLSGNHASSTMSA